MYKLSLILLFVSSVVHAQITTDSSEAVPGNSLYEEVKKKYPDLKYNYQEQSQVHDYSGNWDFDKDGIADSVLWIGNGGAHLMYHLKVVLSKSGRPYQFDEFEIDYPFPEEAKNVCAGGIGTTDFAVADFDSDGARELYIYLDPRNPISDKWRHKGINSYHLLLKFEKDKCKVVNFDGCMMSKE